MPGGAFILSRGHFNITLMIAHNAMTNRKPQARALACRFAGNKGLKQTLQNLGGNARAIVTNIQSNPLPLFSKFESVFFIFSPFQGITSIVHQVHIVAGCRFPGPAQELLIRLNHQR